MPTRRTKGTLERKEVNTMSGLPGFTAAASFYGTSERYAGTALASRDAVNRGVVPQICVTIPVCLPCVHKKVRVCLSIFGGFSWSFVNC